MGLLTDIRKAADAEIAKDQLKADARIILDSVANAYSQIGQLTETIAAKCAKHGLKSLLASLSETTSPEVADKVSQALQMLQGLWGQYSDVPMPELYAEPRVEPIEVPVVKEV